MPISDISSLGQLPAVDPSALPAEIRDGSAEDRKLYTVALGFERVLLEKLAGALAESTGGPGGDDGGGEEEDGFGAGALDTMRQQLPSTFAAGLVDSGGIGLAKQLYDSMRPQR